MGTAPVRRAVVRGSFDHYARLVRRFVGVPVALVSLVEEDRQTFPGAAGLPAPYGDARETPLSHSFCQYVVLDAEALVVPDARRDARLASNAAIEDLGVVAYAGWPLLDAAGLAIGSLCAIDHVVREWTDDDLEILEDLATACSAELQRAMAHEQESEDLARAIVESAGVALAFYDADQQLVMHNPLALEAAAAAGLELDRPPYVGTRVRRADNLTPVAGEDQVIPRALRGAHGDRQMSWLGPIGGETAYLASSTALLRPDGRFRGTLVTAQEVTAQARAVQVRDEFLATVSHELRTPLTSLLGYLELVTEQVGEEGSFLGDALEAMRRSGADLQQRIEHLLAVGDRPVSPVLRSADVCELARRMAVTFGEQARARRITLEVDVELDQQVRVVIDLPRIEQALENVVSNALKYTRAGGCVTLTVRPVADRVDLVVSDDGVGMSQAEVAQAFDTFWRADSAREELVQGVGIGLTLVRAILLEHQGQAEIVSSPGVGTTVTLSLPRGPATLSPPRSR